MERNAVSGLHTPGVQLVLMSGNDLAQVAGTSLALGVLAGACAALLLLGHVPQVCAFGLLYCTFHFLEFHVTARHNTDKVTARSFLLDNGREYHAAIALALVEALVRHVVAAAHSWNMWASLWLVTCLAAQAVRSLAMMQAGGNFSHCVRERRHVSHVLVTSGIYAWVRHPAYVGYFVWAVSSQAMMGNYVTLVVYGVVLVRFFRQRIRTEEKLLYEFFGEEYSAYAKRVGAVFPRIRR